MTHLLPLHHNKPVYSDSAGPPHQVLLTLPIVRRTAATNGRASGVHQRRICGGEGYSPDMPVNLPQRVVVEGNVFIQQKLVMLKDNAPYFTDISSTPFLFCL